MEKNSSIIALTFVVECMVSKDGTQSFILRRSNGSPVEFSHQFADIQDTILSAVSQVSETVSQVDKV